MKYWLIKTEPNTYSWEDLLNDKRTFWDGVRNYQARNNLKAMELGDLCLYYHSVKEKAVVGTAKVVKTFYQDPSTEDDRWVAVDVEAETSLKKRVTLEMVKNEPDLAQMVLVNNSRLSVQPVRKEEFDKIIAMGMEEQ